MAVQKSETLEFISLPASGHAGGKTMGLEFCQTFVSLWLFSSQVVLSTSPFSITNSQIQICSPLRQEDVEVLRDALGEGKKETTKENKSVKNL